MAEILFAIGDIHGCKKELDVIHDKIKKYCSKKNKKPIITYLGDYIDRGPKSKDVIQTIIEFTLPNVEKICLLGNHEQMLLDVLNYKENSLYQWIANSGVETLESYGGSLSEFVDFNMELSFEKKIYSKIHEFIPNEHKKFYDSLKLFYVWKNYIFVHAGINPLLDIKKQEKETLIWTRDKKFFDASMKYPKRIVHGHTPVSDVEFNPYRINIDTGCFNTGKLTCLVIDEDKIDILNS